MKRSALLIFAMALLVTALPTMAQQAGNGTGPAADPSAAFDVYGTVISFTASAGSGMPMLEVDDATLGAIEIGLGPLWFLQEAGFSAMPGDEVEGLVFTCTVCSADYVALWVDNMTTGASVVLRGEDGKPLWIQRGGTGGGQGFCLQSASDAMRSGQGSQGGNGGPSGNGAGDGSGTGNGPRGGEGPQAGEGPQGGQGPNAGDFPGGQCEWTGPDMTAATTVTGTVVSVDVGFGNHRPTVVLDIGGEEVEILLMPYSPLAAAGFLIQPGTELQVTYAPWLIFGAEEVLVAISVTDPATGLTVQLRDPETGYPVTGGGGGWGPYYGYGPGPGGDD